MRYPSCLSRASSPTHTVCTATHSLLSHEELRTCEEGWCWGGCAWEREGRGSGGGVVGVAPFFSLHSFPFSSFPFPSLILLSLLFPSLSFPSRSPPSYPFPLPSLPLLFHSFFLTTLFPFLLFAYMGRCTRSGRATLGKGQETMQEAGYVRMCIKTRWKRRCERLGVRGPAA
jgi:hypothetical protein